MNNSVAFKTYSKDTFSKKKKMWYWCKSRQNRSMEQDRKFINRPSHIWTSNF